MAHISTRVHLLLLHVSWSQQTAAPCHVLMVLNEPPLCRACCLLSAAVLAAPVLRSLQEGLLSSLADRGFLEDAATFLSVGQSLTSIDSVFMSGLGFPVLLSEPVLKKLFRDDADGGAGLVMEVLIGMQLAGVPVPAKCQDAVSKVRPRPLLTLCRLQ